MQVLPTGTVESKPPHPIPSWYAFCTEMTGQPFITTLQVGGGVDQTPPERQYRLEAPVNV